MSDSTPAPAATPDKAPQLTGELPTSSIEEFLENHGKKTVTLIVLAVVAAGIFFFIKSKKETSRVEQGEAFVSAVTRSDLEAVAKKYAGTVAGGNALLMLADRQLSADMTKEAQSTLKGFIATHSDDPLYYNGVFALACVEEKLGNTDAALAGFQEVAAAGADAVPAASASLRAADVLLAKGELEKAKEAYEGLAVRFPGSPFIMSSEKRIEIAEQRITLHDNPPPAPEPEPEPVPAPGEVPPALAPPEATTIPTPDATTVNPTPDATPEPAPEGVTPDPAVEGTVPPEPEIDLGTTPAPDGDAAVPAPDETGSVE